MEDNKIEPIQPENISAESEQWNATAEGLLRRLLWQIETGQVKPKEMAVAYFDYKGGVKRHITLEATDHDAVKINGLLHLAVQFQSDKVLYGED